ncbi:MAG: molybdopterin-dependent oxidoreductase [Deltaproteobacteria bacterium]|jgi:anaerobic selenocysteine-containing dehydrogenase|nr:molybdopterin-dependent oxidoreductase [Deltaproteobacteria bacterium]
MKIGRRGFLSFVIGGAAGTALSPLPWKLMDDSSIWTQMWPWTPVPKDGETSYVNSVCTLCTGGCGITVRKVDERAVKIEGMKGHPINDGGACLIGLSGLQLLYGPTRVKGPLKRTGKRGEGRWERISWKEAISEVVEKLGNLRSKGQSHTVGFVSGSDRGTIPRLFERFLTVFGSPNLMRMPSVRDSYELTLRMMQGVQALPGFDFENADFVLSLGSGIIDGWGSPVRMFRANSNWQNNNVKVIQIEPRLSNTAAKSSKWIPINPGTEAALVMGLAYVIIKESLYDTNFILNDTQGFEDWKRLVMENFSPDSVAAITGIDSGTIVVLARSFANASRPLAICGRGDGSSPVSLKDCMAVHSLNALVGNVNKEGGVWAVSDTDYIRWPEVEMDARAAAGIQHERLDGAGSKKYLFSRYLMNRLPEAVNSGEQYPLQALFVSGANPLYTFSDTKSAEEAFDKIPFVVSFSSYMDETAQNADLILPNHVFLERYEDVPAPIGLIQPVIGLSRPVIEPQLNTRHVGDVIIQVAKGLGGSVANAFPWESYNACLKETLNDKWEILIEKGFWSDTELMRPTQASSFDTVSGKFEFINPDIGSMPQYKPVNIEGDERLYPLLLIPYDSIRLANGYIGDPPFAVKTVEDTVLKGDHIFIEINPKTARSAGLQEGQRVLLSTPKGKAEVKIHLFEGIMPGVIALPRGLGHTGYDDYLAGKGVNFNTLIGTVEDSDSGMDVAWGIRAKLSNV